MAVGISGVILALFAILNAFDIVFFLEKIDLSNHSLWLKEYLCHNYSTLPLYLFCYKRQFKTIPYAFEKIVL